MKSNCTECVFLKNKGDPCNKCKNILRGDTNYFQKKKLDICFNCANYQIHLKGCGLHLKSVKAVDTCRDFYLNPDINYFNAKSIRESYWEIT